MRHKKFKKIHLRQLLFIVLIQLFVITIISTTAFASSRLYFDDDGSLIFVSRGGKDHTGIKYRTIGWILKRYDLPMDAKGQQYVIIPKRAGGNTKPDPTNSEILISYFKSDSTEILNAIGRVSEKWKNQLINYGGDVYIDCVMTVVMYGVEMGAVSESGELSGEVYCTYEGISEARPWGSKEEFKQFYNLVVEYPARVKKNQQRTDVSRREEAYKSDIVSDISIGSGTKGNQIYDIKVAIPSGEKIYLDGKVSKYTYEVKTNHVKGIIKIPIEVTTTYLLKWKGEKGENKEERRTVSRYYDIEVQVSYYELESINVFGVNGIILENGAIEKNGIFSQGIKENISVDKTIYGAESGHISVNVKAYCVHSGTRTITVNSILKPSIPDENYESLAKAQITDVSVKSDKLAIGGNYILKDSVCSKNGRAPIYFKPPTGTVYIEDIALDKGIRNNSYSTVAKVKYKSISADIYETKGQSIENINIYTPIVSDGYVVTDNKYNQEVTPQESTIVLGCRFKINTGATGFHSDNKGYGERNYDKYIKKKQVKFPFSVEKDGILYKENVWIDTDGESEFYLPDCVDLGDYNIEVRNYAINSISSDRSGGEKSNGRDEYFAYSVIKAHIAGRLYDYTVDGEYKVKDLLREGYINDEIEYTMKVAGNYQAEDFIRVKFNYSYYKDKKRIPVNVYVVEKRDSISTKVKKLRSFEDISINSGVNKEKNLTEIKGIIALGGEIYIFPENVEINGAKDIVKHYGERMINGSLIVGAEAYVYKDNVPYISYINEENSKKGYCNMWKEEGFAYKQNIGGEDIELEAGDSICYFAGKKGYFGYVVVGTH